MILYLDTSALLKKYFRETGPDKIIVKRKEATAIVTSSMAYAKALASIHLKKREVRLLRFSTEIKIRQGHQ